jgi:16S rRNA U516 pseudouridylate synthase RsuA-like enzyme
MLEAINNEVVYLKRLRIWNWTLDCLNPWEWKFVEI